MHLCFNSLFEMQGHRVFKRAAAHGRFNSLFEMPERLCRWLDPYGCVVSFNSLFEMQKRHFDQSPQAS